MSIIDAINQNTNFVFDGKMRLKAAINNNGGSVSQAGTVPTFQELIDGLTGVTGSGVNTSVSGDTLKVSAMSNISAGSVVKIFPNDDFNLLFDLSDMLPITANVDGATLTMYKSGQSYSYEDVYTPVVSKSGKMMVGFYRSATDVDVAYAVPFYKVDNNWVQMKVNGAYTAAHRREEIGEYWYSSGMFSYDDSVGTKLAVIGDTIYEVNAADLNITSKHTLDMPDYTYIAGSYIFGSLVVIAYYKSGTGHKTVVYNYDIANRTSALLSNFTSSRLSDITVNGTDVYVLLNSLTISKYSIGTDGAYSRVGTLSLPHVRTDGGAEYGFLARGCAAAMSCDAGGINGSLRYYDIDVDTFTLKNDDVDVTFPSENVYIYRVTKDFKYMLVRYIPHSSDDVTYIWEQTIDENTGKIKYINLGQVEYLLNGVTDYYQFTVENYQYLFDNLEGAVISVGSRADHKQSRILSVANNGTFYSAIGSNLLTTYEDVVATGYALEDIPFGNSGMVKVTSYVYGAEQEIKQSSAYVNAQLDDINGETV